MPKFFWSIAALVILAILSSFAAATDPERHQLPMMERLLMPIWQEQANSYAAEAFELVSRRVERWRSQGGHGEVGIYLQEIGSGFELMYDAWHTQMDEQGAYSGYYHTASVAKLLIAYAVYHLDDLGEIDIEEQIFDRVTEQTYQMQPLIRRMLTHSVNLYHNVLLRRLGPTLANNTLARLGLLASRLSRELYYAPGTSDAT